MRNKRPLVLLLLACCLAQPTLGQTTFGTRDCGQWMKRTDSVGIKNASETWLIGYMSGLSTMYWIGVEKNNKHDPLKKVNSAEQMFLWMDNYCNKNPLNIVSQGGVDLFTELRDK